MTAPDDVDLDRVWTNVAAEVWRRRPGRLEQTAAKLLRSPGLARALLTTPSLLGPWLIGSTLVLAIGALVQLGANQPLVWLIAPAVAAGGSTPVPLSDASPSPAPVARERLQILLSHERGLRGQPDLLELLRAEILAVVSRHVTIDPEKITVKMDRGGDVSTLEIDIEVPNVERSFAAAS